MSDQKIPVELLDDLSSRFIINIPEEERNDPIRLFFQIELAHWYYIDFYRSNDPQLKSCGMKEFTRHLLKHIPTLSYMLADLDTLYDNWKGYKSCVPTYGAIILNEDMTKVLLVQSFYEKASWGFPKGKVNEEEDPAKCAVREVLEETGFDISKLICEDQYIEAIVCDQATRLYIVHGIKETEKFHPKTRNEIKCVEWFNINDLPTSKKDNTSKLRTGVRPNSFFMTLPFIKRIKNWILENNVDLHQGVRKRHRHKSVGDMTSTYLKNAKPRPTSSTEMEMTIQNLRISAQNSTPLKANKNPKEPKINSKVFYRRQLFDNLHSDDLGNSVDDLNPAYAHKGDIDIIVPRWLNFKLDRANLIQCFDI